MSLTDCLAWENDYREAALRRKRHRATDPQRRAFNRWLKRVGADYLNSSMINLLWRTYRAGCRTSS